MGLYDRDYTRADYNSKFHYAPQMRMGFPKITPVVKWLLIINVAVYLVSIIIPPFGRFAYRWFPLDATSVPRVLQLWRLVTYQFLHDPNFIWHIFFNMLGLFFLGPTLERYWGSRRFLPFYLGCGVAGALFYMLLVLVGFLPAGEMVGASGAILGMLAACAILFPQFVVIILFFPVPIRVAAVAFTAIYIVTLITKGANAGGDAAHLAGMAAGAAYVYSKSWRTKFNLRVRTGRWQRKMARQRELQFELDRILQKVHEQGIHSLTAKEKRILQKATEAERMKNKL